MRRWVWRDLYGDTALREMPDSGLLQQQQLTIETIYKRKKPEVILYSSVKTVRGVLRPAFQMAVDDDYLQKNPFGFQLAGVVINDSVTREAITKDQMCKFLKFVRDDNNYCKYYEAFYILFHTGMRISEFCGLTIRDLDMEKRIIDINKQLQRGSKMEYFIESTKTNAGTPTAATRRRPA